VTSGDGAYASGPALLALAGSALADRDLGAVARPILENLQRQTGHSVHFAVRSGTVAVYLAKVEGRQPYRMTSRVGMQVALHCTAIGKAVLSELPEEEVNAVIAAASPLIRHTPAAAVHDRQGTPIGAVSVSSLTFTLDDDDVGVLGPLVVAAAGRISSALGRRNDA